MKDLITEARELIEALHAGEYDDEYIGTGAYLMLDEMCDALEKAEEQNKQLVRELCKLACESVERDRTLAKLEAEVEGWAKAKQEGRLVVLPCKVGDTVYRIEEYHCCTNPDWDSSEVIEDGFGLEDIACFGTTVFLTREEAEAAMEGE